MFELEMWNPAWKDCLAEKAAFPLILAYCAATGEWLCQKHLKLLKEKIHAR